MDFEEAKKVPKIRQEFLNTINSKDYGIKSLIYQPKQKTGYNYFKREKGDYTAITECFGIKAGIVNVYPKAFSDDTHENINDFLSTIFEHEGFHIKQMLKRKKLFMNTFTGTYLHYGFPEIEMPAVANQIANLKNRNVSENYAKRVIDKFGRQNEVYEVIKEGLFYEVKFKQFSLPLFLRSVFINGR